MSDDYSICPYDKSHRILKFRMPRHLIKCVNNYRGPPLEQCIYNAQHFVKIGEMAEHLEGCEAHRSFHEAHHYRLATNFIPNRNNLD